MDITKNQNKIFYYNAKEPHSIYGFCKTLCELIKKKADTQQKIILLCIGSDRATGDCLGPIIGYKLNKLNYTNLVIYGTLSNPVHAKNLNQTIKEAERDHPNSVVIAIDASLGSTHHIGYITLGEGSLNPGVGVDKNLPSVGDISITGIVNISGILNHMLLQTTRLDTVMELADYICLGLRYALSNLYHPKPLIQ